MQTFNNEFNLEIHIMDGSNNYSCGPTRDHGKDSPPCLIYSNFCADFLLIVLWMECRLWDPCAPLSCGRSKKHHVPFVSSLHIF